MIAIRESHKGSYEVNFEKAIELFKKKHGDALMREVEKLMKEGRKINIYLDPVIEFSKGGYQSLNEMIQHAVNVKCKLFFTYYGVDISHRIELLAD